MATLSKRQILAPSTSLRGLKTLKSVIGPHQLINKTMKICKVCLLKPLSRNKIYCDDCLLERRRAQYRRSSRNYINRIKSNQEVFKVENENLLNKRHRYEEKNREKMKARNKLRYNVRSGVIEKKNCLVCGDTKSEAHHEDYSKPLEVMWFCKKHHAEFESNKKNKLG
jgi:hypothetical protein